MAVTTPSSRQTRVRRSAVLLWAGLTVVGLFVVLGIFAPWIAPHDPVQQDIANTLQAPFWGKSGSMAHPLGTDALGQDVLSGIIYGARVSLVVAISAVFLSGSFGVAVGLLAGFLGGWVDNVLMRITYIQLSIPFILLAIAMIGALGPSMTNVILVIAVTNWVAYARVARAETLSIRERDFVKAARVSGTRLVRVLAVHILPNVLNSVVVLATLDIGKVIIFESGLSFLGLGVQPPTPSWGAMLADGRKYINIAYWLTTFPGLTIMTVVLGVNFLGDWVRERLDPKFLE
jgi:peptide/nickel transport system permease protein